jgi:chromosome partitioning protein
MDPQANASTALDIEHDAHTLSSYELLIGANSARDVIRQNSQFSNLYVIPSSINLAGAEVELISASDRDLRLKNALSELANPETFDFILIDCPPSLGVLSLNALSAATDILIPVQAEYYALEGLSLLLQTVDLVKNRLNPKLADPYFLLTMYNSRTSLAHDVENEVRSHFGVRALQTIIPRTVRISEAPSYNQTILTYDRNSTGSLAYQEAAFELANLLGQERGLDEQ